MKKKKNDPVDKIEKGFKILKDQGIKAKNPDQSTAMTRTFAEDIDTCRWKGFSEKDIEIMFKTAQKFESFLESLKGHDHDILIESVKKGFRACFEHDG